MKIIILGLAILGCLGLSLKKNCVGRVYYVACALVMIGCSLLSVVEKLFLNNFLENGLTYETAWIVLFVVVFTSCACFIYLTEEGGKSLKCLRKKQKRL